MILKILDILSEGTLKLQFSSKYIFDLWSFGCLSFDYAIRMAFYDKMLLKAVQNAVFVFKNDILNDKNCI